MKLIILRALSKRPACFLRYIKGGGASFALIKVPVCKVTRMVSTLGSHNSLAANFLFSTLLAQVESKYFYFVAFQHFQSISRLTGSNLGSQ